MCCGLAHCPRAKSTRFSIIPVVSFSHVHAISSRLQCNTADLPSGRWIPTLPSQYPGYQRKQSTLPWTSNDSCVPFFVLEIPLHWLSLGFRIILKYPSFITSNYRIQQIWFILNALQKVQTQFLVTFFLFIWPISEPFLHKPFSCSILPLEFIKHFPCPNWLPQLLLEHPTFSLFKSHLALFQCCHR